MTDDKVEMKVERITLPDGSVIELRTVSTWAPDKMLAITVDKNGDVHALLCRNIGKEQ